MTTKMNLLPSYYEGKTIKSIDEKSYYFGYPFEDQGDVSGKLMVISFTDNTVCVKCSVPKDGGDGETFILEGWFPTLEEAIDTKWFATSDEDEDELTYLDDLDAD